MRITDVDLAGTGSSFALGRPGRSARCRCPGHYNVLNAAASVRGGPLVRRRRGRRCARQLSAYGGTYRRFQLVGTVDDVRVYDDYAHHPTEVRQHADGRPGSAAGGGRVVVCFQPHLYTRTRDFWRELAAALELADEAVVMDVCGDREDPLPGIDGRDGRRRPSRPGTAAVTYEPVWDEAAPTVAADRPARRPGDHGRLR